MLRGWGASDDCGILVRLPFSSLHEHVLIQRSIALPIVEGK